MSETASSFLSWLLFAVVAFTGFGLLEGFALRHPERLHTFSWVMATMGAKFPLSIALLGLFFGVLLGHFYFPECL